MKKIINIIAVAVMVLAPLALSAQFPPHPNNGANPGGGNTPVGGGAPIDGGLSILLALGAGYATRKTYLLKKQ